MTGTGTLQWFKSSYSDDGGGNCVEIAYAWRKSSYSDGGGGQCLEVAPCPQAAPTTIHIRDSKNPDGPNLTVSGKAWAAFIGRCQSQR
ncbi:DUF397 domain-containing protein [Streptomyces sp. ISL-22]|uniref:DUF397 domain-containing protein n=1 Tax=unclassified Streptomyces TaxID=2593676 RepID=UPI001BE744E7|nr:MULTISPECIES: DUF397 domain-containing protein [unclassified Streptomyces]MBT2416967.1 DUF397 domain-containing protein [Streptomyces sp. ISL-24]MBT2430659.1 DUF397 domain-containing protein [Streptomyces sp. ISL-22]